MSTDFQQATEAVRRLHAYILNAESPADVATRMQADAGSPFHSFDAIAHASVLQNLIDGLLESAMSAADEERPE